MSDLVVIEFPSEEKAEEVRQKLLGLQKDYLIELGDAVIAVKQPNGHIKLNQLFSTTAVGAAGGAFWGTLIGFIFLMPLAGAAIGAASGALSGKLTDFGINDDFMREAAAIRQCGAVSAYQEDDHGQGARRSERRWRQGFAHLLRQREGSGTAEGARRREHRRPGPDSGAGPLDLIKRPEQRGGRVSGRRFSWGSQGDERFGAGDRAGNNACRD